MIGGFRPKPSVVCLVECVLHEPHRRNSALGVSDQLYGRDEESNYQLARFPLTWLVDQALDDFQLFRQSLVVALVYRGLAQRVESRFVGQHRGIGSRQLTEFPHLGVGEGGLSRPSPTEHIHFLPFAVA